MARPMRLFARWHIWLGWLTGVPLLLWCVSGLVMVAKPIEEVRGNDLRRDLPEQALPPGNPAPVLNEIDVPPTVREIRSFMQNGRAVTTVTRLDGSVARYDAATGYSLPPMDESEARAIVARLIIGGERVTQARLFDADHPPLDFRQPKAAWQVTLANGTHVYVNRDSGEIAAVRTKWWRIYDLFWGLHIMDLQGREDTHHPLLILFATLATVSCILGTTLLFRRRRAPAKAGASGGLALDGGRSPPASPRQVILSDAAGGVEGRALSEPET